MTEFGQFTADGYSRLGTVNQSDMLRCPHVIIAFEHYRADGSCRCDDAAHSEMAEWGYKWDAALGRWS